MSDILFINSCVRANSRTLKLAENLMQKLTGNIKEINLYDTPFLSPLDTEGMIKRDTANKSKDFSDDYFNYAKEFAQAQTIVIAAPYWDLMFPAVLKTYLERICVAGITFRYSSENRPIGMCSAKKLYFVTTAGGYVGNNNFGYTYIKALCQNILGIKDVSLVFAEGLDINPEEADSILNDVKKNMVI